LVLYVEPETAALAPDSLALEPPSAEEETAPDSPAEPAAEETIEP
jgi:hypothetical protein